MGLLDIDICGPSLPKMLGLEGEEVHQSGAGWSPVYLADNLGVMSIGFMLPNPDDAVIWRGPRKNGLIKQFLKDVDWGALDFLLIDSPPGTSDEHISVAQFLKAADNLDGAVVVTTPQEVAIIDVRKEINFCKKVGGAFALSRVVHIIVHRVGISAAPADLHAIDCLCYGIALDWESPAPHKNHAKSQWPHTTEPMPVAYHRFALFLAPGYLVPLTGTCALAPPPPPLCRQGSLCWAWSRT